MIVKAEIQSIDYAGNTCTVRMPVFESAGGGDKAVSAAIVSGQPGIYNGYKPGDIALIAFENGQLQNPVVIGKLYLGAEAEGADMRGSISCRDAVIGGGAISVDAKLIRSADGIDVGEKGLAFKTLGDAVDNVKSLNISKQDKLSAGAAISITPVYGTVPAPGAQRPVIRTDIAVDLTQISGYDATKTQTLKNVAGAFAWVDD